MASAERELAPGGRKQLWRDQPNQVPAMPLKQAPRSPRRLLGWTTISDPAGRPRRFPFHEGRSVR
jgi:hypothetical protein